ncbi:MAG: ketopantoate reductase family protein [Sphaerochaetaceae bacterium]|nr:ketopantoate reductase family protein [Sphaerochaetaceae bacterium]
MRIQKISIIGAGAVGALYAYRLQKVLGTENVRLIADAQRKIRYERDGFILNGETVRFTVVTPDTEVEPADLVILATKNLQLEEAIAAIAKHVGRHTAILSLLNGIESEQRLAKTYGVEHVLWGFVTGLNSVHEENRITFTQEGIIIFVENDNSRTERAEALAELLVLAHINCRIPEDIHHEMWWKFMLNTGYNTLSAVCRANYGDCNAIPAFRECITMVFNEVVQVAAAEGVVFTQEDIDRIHATLAPLTPDGKTSMLQDIEAGRPTENNWFCGTVSRLGEQHGIQTPICDFLAKLTQASEQVRIRRHQGL